MSRDSHHLRLRYPASWWAARWRDALPVGNGIFGAAVYGGIHEETILLSHAELWAGSRTPPLPNVSQSLLRTRQLLREGRASEADRVLSDALEATGYDPAIAAPLPLGDLKVIQPQLHAFREYERTLDMGKGSVTVRWRDGQVRFERSLFVSRTADVLVYEICSDTPGTINSQIYLDLHDRADRRRPDGDVLPPLPEEAICIADGEFLCYAARNDDGADFGAVARVQTFGGTIYSENGKIVIVGADRVLVLVKPFIQDEREPAWLQLRNELNQITEDYNILMESHAAEHGRLFCAMTLELPVPDHEKNRSNEELLLAAYEGETPLAMVEKMWAYGRYLLISSSRTGGQPCPLMGLWCGEYQGLWTFNMVNENLQMIYWQALSGNLPEMMLPVFEYFERRLDDYRTNARHLFGARGIYIPADTAPDSGLLKDKQPHIVHWTGGAGWIAQHFYDYWQYTGDETFLRERAMPFLREAALFYQDFLVQGEGGYLAVMPSVSPENTPGNYGGQNAYMETTINATMDIAIIRELFTHLLEGATRTGLYADEATEWRNLLHHLPPYQVNEDGAIREWMHPSFTDNYHHRHQSHLYPVFPGTEITPHDNRELFQAFHLALRKRLIVGLKEQSGWSLAHMANLYARFGEGDQALECLEILSRSCVLSNLYTVHNDWRGMGIGVDMDWAPFQIDANMGWTAAVQEMLIVSYPVRIRVLPALPTAWESGRFIGMRCRGGITISVDWNTKATRITVILHSASEQTVTVELPAPIREAFLPDMASAIVGTGASANTVTLCLLEGTETICRFTLGENN